MLSTPNFSTFCRLWCVLILVTARAIAAKFFSLYSYWTIIFPVLALGSQHWSSLKFVCIEVPQKDLCKKFDRSSTQHSKTIQYSTLVIYIIVVEVTCDCELLTTQHVSTIVNTCFIVYPTAEDCTITHYFELLIIIFKNLRKCGWVSLYQVNKKIWTPSDFFCTNVGSIGELHRYLNICQHQKSL